MDHLEVTAGVDMEAYTDRLRRKEFDISLRILKGKIITEAMRKDGLLAASVSSPVRAMGVSFEGPPDSVTVNKSRACGGTEMELKTVAITPVDYGMKMAVTFTERDSWLDVDGHIKKERRHEKPVVDMCDCLGICDVCGCDE